MAKKSKAKKSPAKQKAKAKAKPAKQARKAKPKPKPARSAKAASRPKPAPQPKSAAAPVQPLDDGMDSLRNALADILDDGEGFGGEPMPQDVGGRDAIHVELGAKLTATRGDAAQERVAIASAIDSFMRLAIKNGLASDTSAYTAQCPEFFWEGDGANPPVYARVPDATHEEIGRWFQLIVEGVRAYDAKVGATSQSPS